MKKKSSCDYKEGVVKVMWNSRAKQLKEMFFNNYNIKFDQFTDPEFASTRAARDAMRRKLQRDPEKRKSSSLALSNDEFTKIIETCDEDCPDGLQRNFFYVASLELTWRGGEGSSACIKYFTEKINNEGNLSGRIEYNTVFSKTAQGGSKKLSDSKWLVTNNNDSEICLVRLFKNQLEKRGNNIIFNP